MINAYQLFLYTVDEYKRFQNNLPVKNSSSLTDEYSETDYICVQVRLMLLRKYFSGGKNPENVNINNIVSKGQQEFPLVAKNFEEIGDKFKNIEKQQIEQLLSDGTKLNLYMTIEDTVYGLYLHADENRIQRLCHTNESIRFSCIRKFVLEIEKVVFELYDLLKECGVSPEIECDKLKSPMLYLGDPDNNTQAVTGSPYWGNVYGRDATEEDLTAIGEQLGIEEMYILSLCMTFAEELKTIPLRTKKLKKFIHPAARTDWGDFKEAQSFYLRIPNPGFSTKVRYNDAKDTAYVRFFPKVDDAFFLDTPHVFSDVYEFSLGKWFGKWMIYSFGGHLDSIYKKK